MTRDLLWALRWLRKNPLFTAGVTLILALGIGANTAVFSIVDAVLLRGVPYRAADRLVRVEETATKRLVSGTPAEDYLRFRDRSDLFEQTVPYVKEIATLIGGTEPDQITILRTGGGLFGMLGARARLGRTLVEADDQPASSTVAVLSDRLWQRLFHADPGVVGRTVRLGDEVLTIAGVMPAEFEFQYPNVEMWVPLRLTRATTSWIDVAARLRPGVQAAQAQSALEALARELEREDPKGKEGLRVKVSAWSDTPDRNYELTLVLILAAVGLVLLIACADVGGLLLSRAVERQKEIAIRVSLGAGIWRIVRQLLAESLVLAAMGSAAGMAAAYYVLQFLSRQLAALPIMLPHLQRVGLNGRVLGFNAALCLLMAALCGLAPVFSASRTDLEGVLRSGTRSAGGSARLFAVLIACETAFAFLLLAGSGLMIHSLVQLEREDHGFRPDHVLTMRVPVGSRTQPRSAKYDTKARQMAYYHELMERLERVPGTRAVAVVNNPPLSGVASWVAVADADGKPLLTSTRTISARYFDALGIPLLSGRTFNERDQAGAPGVVIVNEYLARQMFPGSDPVGRHLREPDAKTEGSTIVGVVKDSAQMSYDQKPKGEMYFPYQQFIFATFMSTVVARTSGEPLSVANAFRREVWAVDPDQPVVKVETMNEVIAEAIWRPRFSAWIFSVLGGVALLLTSAGVYSVVAYTTTLRAREVGIRMALGATVFDVMAMILRGVMAPLLGGLVVGLAGALLLSRLLGSLLYEIHGTDPVAYVAAAALLVGIGACASARPAWKAAAGDPLKALRME